MSLWGFYFLGNKKMLNQFVKVELHNVLFEGFLLMDKSVMIVLTAPQVSRRSGDGQHTCDYCRLNPSTGADVVCLAGEG